jgi:hypothetical protein
MRPRFVIPVLTLALAILALLFWLRPAKPRIVSTSGSAQSAQSPVPQTNREPTNPPAVIARSSASQGNTVSPATASDEETKIRQAAERNVPVQFYGMVLDQDSNALSGVRVKLGARHNTLIMNSEDAAKYAALSTEEQQKVLNPTTEVVSGSDGRFQWTDSSITGDILGVGSLQKDGYEPEPGQYSCGAGVGNYGNPVIFKMWSTNIHEKLIIGNKTFDLVPDGRAYFISLTDGAMNETGQGDLKVSIQYTNLIKDSQLYDWSGRIDVISGGLFEESLGSPMYMAPTDGYTPAFQLNQKIKGYQRGSLGKRQFYLVLKNGQEYGQMTIDLNAPFNDQTPGLVRLSYAINPSGSRILR